MVPSALVSTILNCTDTVPAAPLVLLMSACTNGEPSSCIVVDEDTNSKTPAPPCASMIVTDAFCIGIASLGVANGPIHQLNYYTFL